MEQGISDQRVDTSRAVTFYIMVLSERGCNSEFANPSKAECHDNDLPSRMGRSVSIQGIMDNVRWDTCKKIMTQGANTYIRFPSIILSARAVPSGIT